MTRGKSYVADASVEKDFYVDTGAARGRFGNTRTYAAMNGAGADGEENKGNRNAPPKSDPRMESKGRERFGEVRRSAGERRRFVKRRRGLLMSLAVLCFSVLVILLIYQFVFVVSDVTVVGEGIYSSETLLEASGVRQGVNLYSFRASTVEKRLTLSCPYIKEVEIDRRVPNNVTITVFEDRPVYYAVIFGEYKILSEGLRVLDSFADKASVPEGLVKLNLPSVSYSISGRVLRLADEKRERGVRDVLATIGASALCTRITMIDLRDQFDMYAVCDSQFKLMLGKEASLEYKLNVAAKVLEDEMFLTDDKLIVDLTTDGKTGVIVDNLMEVE